MSSPIKARLSRSPVGTAVRAVRAVQQRAQRPIEGTPGAPDFVGIGSVGGGGAWWHGLLALHPEIRPPRDRQAAQRFFDDFCFKPLEESDIAAYHARFAKTPGTKSGEWTDVYSVQPWTLPLLPRVAPDAKILLMLVNPLDAYRKAYLQRKARVERGDKRVWMNTAAADRQYGTQLSSLYRFVDPANVLVLQLERCRQDPAGQYKRTLQFLGVRDSFLPPAHRLSRTPRHERVYDALQKAHVPDSALDATIGRPAAGHTAVELWPDVEQALHADLDAEMVQLAELAPEVDLALWPDFAHLAGDRASAVRA